MIRCVAEKSPCKLKFPKKGSRKYKKVVKQKKKLKVKFWNEKHNKASHRVEGRGGGEHVGDEVLLAAEVVAVVEPCSHQWRRI